MRDPIVADSDVVVVGSGVAGITAALAARRSGVETLLVTTGIVGGIGASFFPMSPVRGIDAAPEDDPRAVETHFNEIISTGLGHADPTLARILAEEAPVRLRELVETSGVALKLDESGRTPARFRGCFSDHRRAVIIEDLADVRDRLRRLLSQSGARTIASCAVTELVVDGEGVSGLTGILRDGQRVEIATPAVILAAGGGCGLFDRTLTSPDQLGDAYVLAGRAGAAVRNLRFIQIMLGTRSPGIAFFPLALFDDPRTRIVDDQGCDQTDRLGAAMALRNRHFPFTTRDASMAIDIAAAENPLFAETSVGKFALLSCAHASNGGIVIDERAETRVPGLFACGEAATGMYGADRLGGNMFSAALVFGARAGRSAAQRARESRGRIPGVAGARRPERTTPSGHADDREILASLRKTMTSCALIPRTPGDLARGRALAAEALATVTARSPAAGGGEERRRAMVAAECCLLMLDDMLAHPGTEGPHYVVGGRPSFQPRSS